MSTNGTATLGTMPTVLLVGRTKSGKTSQIVRAFGPRCFYLCTERGAIIPALNPVNNPSLRDPDPAKRWLPVLGRDYVECLSEEDPAGEVHAALDAWEQQRRCAGAASLRCTAVAIDTFSSLADRDMAWLERTMSGSEKKKFGAIYGRLYDRLKRIVWRLMRANVAVIAACHERDPSIFEGKFTPGGVELPGKLVKQMPALFDLVLRCVSDVNGAGDPHFAFRCNALDTDYITGDRFGVVLDGEAADLRSVLRRAWLVSKGRWQEAEAERPKLESSAPPSAGPPGGAP